MAIIPNFFLDEEAYLNERYEDFRKVEGAIPWVYTDSRGIPTVGIGYALLIQIGGSFVVRDNWEQILAGTGLDLSDVDLNAPQQMFDEIVGILNQGGANAVDQAQEIIPPASAGENAGNTTGLPLLDDQQMRNLFDQSIGAYQNILAGRIGAALVDELTQSRELISLLSLTYNSPSLIGQGLTGALQSGDRPEAWFQIRQYSNGGDLESRRGIAKRRYYEAHTLGLYNSDRDNVTAEEANSVLTMYNAHRIRIDAYEADYSEMIDAANGDYGLTEPGVIRTMDEELEFAQSRA